MKQVKLEELPRETLIELARMYARNWQTLDGLWFGNVEAQYGLEAAIKLDLKNWERQSVVFYYPRCPVQEGRKRQGKQEFPCKAMKLTLLSNIARVVEPRAAVKCLTCPPDPHPDKFWCKWELTMKE